MQSPTTRNGATVPAEEQTETYERPLLIIISESDRPSELRSRIRDVWRWRGVDAQHSFDGDPSDPATYEWVRSASAVTAVVDLEPSSRSRSALTAIRAVRSDAAVMLLSPDLADIDQPGDGTLARRGQLRDVLRVDVEDELERLEAERRAYCLRQFAAGDDVVPILIHSDPDPDAVSSALAVMKLLGGSPQRTPIVTLDEMTRPENRRMAELLHIGVTRITRDELMRFERVITVDTQPEGLQEDGWPRFAVIDHHPVGRGYAADFSDVRPHYGATATMLTEYLRGVDEKLIGKGLATALLYGIRTDTDILTRGVTSADVTAYAYLQTRADAHLVRRFERSSYSRDIARAFGTALACAEHDDDLVVVCPGALDEDEAYVLADLADFCLSIENITWVVAAAEIGDQLIFTIRHIGSAQGAGTLAHAIADLGGAGGGHAAMARAMLPRDIVRRVLGGDADAPAVLRLVRRVMEQSAEAPASRRGSHPVHPA